MVTDTLPPSANSSTSAVANLRQILTAEDLSILNQRSNIAGTLRVVAHLGLIVTSGYIWTVGSGWLAIGALLLLGVSLAFMFCTVHECVHRTAFANVKVNDAIAWLAGVLSFYNSTFYRKYHKWHHRYTRIPGKDPELLDLEPKTLSEYLWVVSGIPWWVGKVVGHVRIALGRLEDCYYLPEASHRSVIRSTRLQLGVYVAIAIASAFLGNPLFLFKYWILPLAVGQPLLRFVLLAEHTGCTYDDNALANTRTTLTLWPLRFLMWNMPYHAEHHLYPSIPFHALPAAHGKLKEKFSIVDAGYLKVNRGIVANLEGT